MEGSSTEDTLVLVLFFAFTTCCSLSTLAVDIVRTDPCRRIPEHLAQRPKILDRASTGCMILVTGTLRCCGVTDRERAEDCQ